MANKRGRSEGGRMAQSGALVTTSVAILLFGVVLLALFGGVVRSVASALGGNLTHLAPLRDALEQPGEAHRVVEGVVQAPAQPLVAPRAGGEVVAFDVEITYLYEDRQAGDSSQSRAVGMGHALRSVPFKVVEEGGATWRVESPLTQLMADEVPKEDLSEIPSEVEPFVEKIPEVTLNTTRFERIRIEQLTLAPGDKVLLFGTGQGGAEGQLGPGSLGLVAFKGGKEAFLAFYDLQDGIGKVARIIAWVFWAGAGLCLLAAVVQMVRNALS